MKTNKRKTLIGTLMLGALALAHTGASAAPEAEAHGVEVGIELAASCPSHPKMTLEDFPPYKYEIRPVHKAQIDALALSIATTLKSKSVTRIRIVGHAAKYGSSDFAKTARYRASVVEAELKAALSSHGVDYSKLRFHSKGVSTDCPVASNGTKAGRAKNRRVEIWVDTKAKPAPKPAAKKITTRGALLELKRSSNPTTQCLASKVLKASVDHDYLPDDGLSNFMSAPIQKVGFHGYTSFERDLKDWLNDQVRRIRRVPTKESDQARFEKSFMRAQSSLLRTARMLDQLDCYDKRTPAVRRYLLNQSKKSNSLYSCTEVKKEIERAIDSVGGVRGCRA